MTTKPKKIMFFLPTLSQGGGERVVSELSQHFSKKAETVLVVFERRMAYPFQGKVISLSSPLSKSFFPRIGAIIFRFARFRKVLSQEKPDVIITIGGVTALIALLLHPKVVVRVDSFASEAKKGFWGFLYKLTAKILFRKAYVVVSVSHAAAEDLVKNFGVPRKKVRVLYNPIDIPKIQQRAPQDIPRHLEVVFQHPVLVAIGRFSSEKRHWLLLEIFERVKKTVPNAQLVILGDGSLRGEIEGIVREKNLEKSVHLIGWQQNPYQFLSRATLLIFTSMWEGFPVSIVESLACGTPVISSDCTSGPREILAPRKGVEEKITEPFETDYGVLIPIQGEGQNEVRRETEEFVSSIISSLGNNKRLRTWSENAKLRAQDFDSKIILKDWDFLFETS